MTTRFASTMIPDEALAGVSGGGVMKALETIGREALDGAKFGAKIGMYGGPVFAFGGIYAGGIVGAINGAKNVAFDAVKSLIG